jgi:hypothetical protein
MRLTVEGREVARIDAAAVAGDEARQLRPPCRRLVERAAVRNHLLYQRPDRLECLVRLVGREVAVGHESMIGPE